MKLMALQNGDRYGRLVILGIDRQDKHRNNIYKCRCDCGNITFVRGNGLTSGNTKSCGCLSSEVKRSKRLPKDQGVINHIILQYKRHARDRGLSWNLTYEQVANLIQQPCFYCGAERSNHKVTKNCKEGYDHNGIDRIDSSIGYEPSNVVPCCKICNYAKSDMKQKDFIEWAHRVAHHTEAMAEQWTKEWLVLNA